MTDEVGQAEVGQRMTLESGAWVISEVQIQCARRPCARQHAERRRTPGSTGTGGSAPCLPAASNSDAGVAASSRGIAALPCSATDPRRVSDNARRGQRTTTQNKKARVLDPLGLSCFGSGRGERIRTSGLYVPNVALYQAKLHPEGKTQRNAKDRPEQTHALRSNE